MPPADFLLLEKINVKTKNKDLHPTHKTFCSLLFSDSYFPALVKSKQNKKKYSLSTFSHPLIDIKIKTKTICGTFLNFLFPLLDWLVIWKKAKGDTFLSSFV